MDSGQVKLKALHGRKFRAFLCLVDVAGLVISFALMLVFRFGTLAHFYVNGLHVLIPFFVLLFSLYILGAYDLSGQHRFRTLIARFLVSVIVSFLLLLVCSYIFALGREGLWGRGVLMGSLATFFVWGCLGRIIFWKMYNREVKKKRYLLLMSSQLLPAFTHDVQRTGLRNKFDFLLEKRQPGNSVIGTWDDYSLELANKYDAVILAPSNELSPEVIRQLLKGRLVGQRIIDLVEFYEEVFGKVPVFYLHEWLLISTPGFYLNQSPVRYRLKRIFDITASLTLLIFSFPFLIAGAALVKLSSPGPILFSQQRVGRGGECFSILKLRTMRQDAEKDGAQWAQNRDPRVTRTGRFLRASRIDELPQIWNVLRGDMSLIGPRPERPEFTSLLEKEIPFYALRHSVLPGITGWAQVLFPYGSSVEDAKDKLQYELYYIRNYSIWMDLKILLQTIQVVIFGRGR